MIKKYGLFIFPILFLLFIRFGLNFNGLYGQDAYEYLRYATRLKAYLSGANLPGDYFWPIGFPLCGALLSFITRDVSLALQLVSTLAFLGTLFYAKKILELLFPAQNGKEIYLFVFLLLSPFLLRGSILCMSDLGALFFCTAFIYYAFQFRKNGKSFLVVLLFFFAANAFMFRYVAPLLLLFPSLFIFKEVFKKKHLVYVLFGIVIFVFVLLPHLLIRSETPMAFLHHEWLSGWSFANYFHSSFLTGDGQADHQVPNIVFSFLGLFNPGNFCFGMVTLYFLFRKHTLISEEKILLLSVLLYLLFMAGMPIQNLRFLLLPLPLLILGSFRGFIFLFGKLKPRMVVLFFILAILFQSALFIYSFKNFYARNKLEKTIKEWMIQNTKQEIIYSFDMDVSLKAGMPERKIVNLWEKKYDEFELNGLVLFNAPRFEQQWKGKNPMLNWENLNNKYHLQLLKTFPEGWNLYEIE